MANKTLMVLVGIAWLLCQTITKVRAQPYFDVAGLTSWYIPGNKDVSEWTGTAFVAIPINLGKQDKFIFYPVYESRKLKYEETDSDLSLSSLSLLLIWRHQSKDSSWVLTTSFLPRTNSSDLAINNTTLQPGAAILNTFRINYNLKVKFGLYYNKEYFGGYFIPLAGIDWKINEKWNLFGVLPNTMKLEYKVFKFVYTGLSLKTITNSYMYENEDSYFKIKDNHLCIFADFYLPHNITLMAEAGITVLKETKNRSEVSFDEERGDGLIVKAGIYYRLRFD